MNKTPELDWKEITRVNSLTCSREILRHLRRAKGWTQARLAEVAGYSERLISKAEKGEALALSTIEDLAEALSTEERKIYPEDLVSDPLLRTREIVLMLQQHRTLVLERLENWLDENVEMHLIGHPKVKSCPSRSTGRTQVVSVLGFLWDEVGGSSLNLENVHCVGSGTEVSVWSKLSCESTGADATEGVQTCSRLEYCRGQICRIELMIDAECWRKLLANHR
jgi:transcriptional regulator with XRE-family HTH domain